MTTISLYDAPGPHARARQRLITIITTAVLLAATAFALAKLGQRGNLDPAKWTPFLTISMWRDYLLPALLNTLRAAVLSMALSAAFGLVFGIGRLSRVLPIRWFCGAIVEFFRAIPVLVIMIAAFTFYSYNNTFVSTVNPLAAVVTGVALFNGSAIAELLRSGIANLPAGQSEAGLSIGLKPGQVLRSIQLPQAIVAMMPSLIGQFVIVLKDTALGQIITYPELLSTYQQIGSNWSNIVPAMIVIAAIFIAINYSLSSLAERIESRMRTKRRRPKTPVAAPPGAVLTTAGT
jgi:glutamate transport system permease protein